MTGSFAYKKEWNKVNKMAATGQLAKAAKYSEKIYKKYRSAVAKVFMCETLVLLKQHEKALLEYKKGLMCHGDDALFLFSCCRYLLLRGELESAKKALLQGENLRNLSPDICVTLSGLCIQVGVKDCAISLCKECLQVYPDNADLHFNVAGLYLDISDLKNAYFHYYESYKRRSDHFPSAFNLGLVEHRVGNYDNAIAFYKKSIELNSKHIDSYKNICASLLLMGNGEEALLYAKQAVRICSAMVDSWLVLSGVYKELMLIDKAADAYTKALEIDSSSDTAHFYKYELTLLQEKFTDGWGAYEWRFNQQEIVPRHFGFPKWEGQCSDGECVLVYAEQGVGDEVMFSSCIPDMLERGMRVVIDCDPRLGEIFVRSFPGAMVHAAPKEESSEWVKSYPDITYECPIGTLPKYLRKNPNDFPKRSHFLLADESKVQQWSELLSNYGNELKVGISWLAGRNADARKKRSLCLEKWGDVFRVPGVCFFNVQYGAVKNELEKVNQAYNGKIVDFDNIDPMLDLDSLAALLVNLDLVITVDNSTAHLAAALGVPVWVLLPFSPDWRWGEKRNDCLWYQNIRLIRQGALQDWGGVLAEVVNMLTNLTEENNTMAL